MSPAAAQPGLARFDLTGRRALITGSASGIGFTLATALQSAGATVILNGRNPTKLEAARKRLEGSLCYCFDVTDAAMVEETVDQIEREIGPIDILVNNAGMQHRAPLDEFPLEKFQQLMRTNVEGPFVVAKAVSRSMIRRGQGKIINIASVTSMQARAGIAPYTASKGAIKNLTQAMCADWAKHGLQINAIGPGYFATELTQALVDDPAFDGWLKERTPAQRWGKLDDLAGACIFLASRASDFVNGHVLYVDGGMLAAL